MARRHTHRVLLSSAGARRLESRRGQALTEYAISSAIIAIGGIITVFFFGSFVLSIFANLGATMKDKESGPGRQQDDHFMELMERDAGVRRNMQNFDAGIENMTVPSPPSGGGGNSPGPMPPGQTDPSPGPHVPADPLEHRERHHIGDNGQSDQEGGMGSGLLNEGTSYGISFLLTPEMINYANTSGNGLLHLSYDVGSAGEMRPGVSVSGSGVNEVTLDGQRIGYADNGHNVLTLDTASLAPGMHTLTFHSSMLATEYDDYEFSNVFITCQPR